MIKVMIVDDSAVVRSLLREQLEAEPDIDVIGVAPDPLFAFQKLRTLRPDVLVVDVEMPRMDGLTFLRQLMQDDPIPTIVFSSLAEQGSAVALDAMDAGAVAILCKPGAGVGQFIQEQRAQLVQTVRQAATSRMRKVGRPVQSKTQSVPPLAGTALSRTTDALVAIGTSTGGTRALEYLLKRMPKDCTGLVIVQHMPANFTRQFAQRLNASCAIEVQEAQDGDRVIPGRALIAPGGLHLSVRRNGAQYQVVVQDGPPVSRHKPSVDVLFRSVAQAAGRNALGVIMTGMGDDGARGLKIMRDAGALTLAQDEDSCVVFGMPKEAIRHGAVEQICSLDQIPERIAHFGQKV
ncbi:MULTISPECIES: protein-glutamate methylesterase/protein-glutamine glutaminase [Pseudomonadaceae]|jgi:two-component system chemotaxis response regulator CheB|uniref:Protein-glutamate methylesterase/protein-glutamine glutaminase n=1 Tax=Pseudomonas saudiphocaensis TaxID=1499686 RepID=A0A078LQ78_9PSED|nr:MULTISPECIES: chemotaxis response regulator protein-glutamate methylesterase [Pseudomonadaceae]MBE7927846.1 chemotaxis response regulator protein-glutamate methylesterase [Pseudomonas saudiphocaensis]MCF6780736.1 chemotaxis response regulator protein-glutamate methylesterase [Stutzerimonas stutzeri]MCF6803306.1 chemotaxis response regulator protein-glutamate methylesterase [Stutzerimonas stutzeri]CDZ93274.1 protein CheB3 [Pseudomonas saudiphocaensis]